MPRFPRSLEDALWLGDQLAGDDDALPDSSPDPFAIDRGRDVAHLRRLAENTFSEIGALSLLLFPAGSERWTRGIPRFEQRMLNDLDFAIALADPFVPSDRAAGGPPRGRFDVLAALLAYTDDAPAADPARAFTRAFVLGCVEGEDTVRAAVIALRRSHESTHAAQASALALASSPAIGPAMRRLAAGEDAAIARVALDVLAARKEVTLDVAAPPLAHADPGVRRAAARALARVPERREAAALLRDAIGREADDAVFAAAVESLAILGAPSGLAAARARVEDALAGRRAIDGAARVSLLRLMAVAGAHEDAEVLGRSLGRDPGEAEALGWHGYAGHVGPLLDALARAPSGWDGDPMRAAAACAIHRITGILPRAHGRDADPYEPETDAAVWRRLWEERRASLDGDRRHRFGRPFALASTLDELSREDVPASVRACCALELDVLGDGTPWIDVNGWSSRQRLAIEAARAVLAEERPRRGHT